MSRPHPYVLDSGRLAALEQSGLLSADLDPALDRWTRLGSALIGAPSALLSLVDRDRQYFKSFAGLDDDLAQARETPLSHSFCQHVVATRAPLIVSDALHDPRVAGNAAIEDYDIKAYAGVPVTTSDGHTLGSFCVLDSRAREWTADELELLEDLAAGLLAEIELRAALRGSLALQASFALQARTDVLTGLPNRRQLADDLQAALDDDAPRVLAMFDLDGFKSYNDAFGHPAGDALLARLADKLAAAMTVRGGRAYRLGGDEFCVLAADVTAIADATAALQEHGEGFSIQSSHGTVDLVEEDLSAEGAMLAADRRCYGDKNSRSDLARRQAQDVLLSVLREREPQLGEHVRGVAHLARRVGVRLGLGTAALDDIAMCGHMHDIGKVAIPDSILNKPGPLDADEWMIMRQHTVLGERILTAAPSLTRAAGAVRSSHERWDGGGYPDGLAGETIPLPSRIVFACDAYHAMTSYRPYDAARTPADAQAELRANAGTQFDPQVVVALLAELGSGARMSFRFRPQPPEKREPSVAGAWIADTGNRRAMTQAKLKGWRAVRAASRPPNEAPQARPSVWGELRSGLLDDLRDRAARLAQVHRPLQRGRLDGHRPPHSPALRSGDRSRVGCALEHVGALHLREQRQQDDGQLGHRVLWVAGIDLDRVGQVADPDAALGQFVDEVERVADRAAEAVEGVDDDDVASRAYARASRRPGRSTWPRTSCRRRCARARCRRARARRSAGRGPA